MSDDPKSRDVDRLFHELDDLKGSHSRITERLFDKLDELQTSQADVRESSLATQHAVASFIKQASRQLEEQDERITALRAQCDRHSSLLSGIRIWAAAAAVLVPGTLAAVAFVLSRIPPVAWSAFGR